MSIHQPVVIETECCEVSLGQFGFVVTCRYCHHIEMMIYSKYEARQLAEAHDATVHPNNEEA